MIERSKNKLEIELISELWPRDVWYCIFRAANHIDKCHRLGKYLSNLSPVTVSRVCII